MQYLISKSSLYSDEVVSKDGHIFLFSTCYLSAFSISRNEGKCLLTKAFHPRLSFSFVISPAPSVVWGSSSVLCSGRVSQINKSNQIPFPFCSQLIELSILSDLDHLLSNRRMEATDHESCYNVTTQDSRKRLSQEMRKLYGLLFQFSRISNSIQNFFRILL